MKKLLSALILASLVASIALANTASGLEEVPEDDPSEIPNEYKGQPLDDLLSAGGRAAIFGPENDYEGPGNNNPEPGAHDNGRGGVTFVNDPCLDPPPTAPPPENRRRTVQSETEIAVLNKPGESMGKKMVAGYNDSWGFYDNRQGLSGFAYTTDGGNTWIDGGGLPPRVPTGGPNVPAPPPGQDGYFGDPVLAVHHETETFYYASLYTNERGQRTLSVNRGKFQEASPQGTESEANTNCLNHPEETGNPDPPQNQKERIIWEPPVEAVLPPYLGRRSRDFLDKEWLYVDQKTGTLYLTYTRFGTDGSTPIEMVRSYDQGRTWTPPTVIVPNLPDTFNQATMPITTPSGRVIVTWISRTFDLQTGAEVSNRIEAAYSDDDGNTFSGRQTVAEVKPQGEPNGYNRNRPTILNAPYINVDKGADDGKDTSEKTSRPGFGNVYITYFDGKTPLPFPGTAPGTRAADILVSASRDNGTTFETPVKVNDDKGDSTHIFPSVQVDKHGYVYVTWLDRRNSTSNELTEAWANVSHDRGLTFGHDVLQADVAQNWRVRSDARPNFGDYNSSELLGFNQLVAIWADGRFYPPGGQTATPDTVFTIANGLGVGTDRNTRR